MNDSESRLATRLKDKLRECGSETTTEPWRIRLHRGISWIDRAEREKEDPDAQFIFLWIAFNAAYARELGLEDPFRKQLSAFLSAVADMDMDKRLHGLLFKEFSGPIRTLISGIIYSTNPRLRPIALPYNLAMSTKQPDKKDSGDKARFDQVLKRMLETPPKPKTQEKKKPAE